MPTDRPIAAFRLVRLLAACGLLLALAAMAGETRHVLVLYSSHRLLPANLEGEGGLRETIANSTELSAEFLDYPRFEGESYVRTATTFLREKYALRPPEVRVVGGEDALAFLLDHRAQLFPTVPVVHMGVARSFLRSIPPLPADVVGVPVEYDFSSTIVNALLDGAAPAYALSGKPHCSFSHWSRCSTGVMIWRSHTGCGISSPWQRRGGAKRRGGSKR